MALSLKFEINRLASDELSYEMTMNYYTRYHRAGDRCGNEENPPQFIEVGEVPDSAEPPYLFLYFRG
jgi:hypothetical protein